MFMHSKYLPFILPLFIAVTISAAQPSQRPAHRIGDVKVGAFDARNVSIDQFVADLSRRTNILFCVEETRSDSQVLEAGVTLSVEENEPLNHVLDHLQLQHPEIRWSIESGVIVIQTLAAQELKDNPLNMKIHSFEFKGSITELISYLNAKAPGLWAPIWTDTPIIYRGNYTLRADSDVTVREVLCVLGRDYGIRWYAEIRPPLEPNSSTGSGIKLLVRVSLGLVQRGVPVPVE
jgi:hypothetical protein